MKPPPPLTAGSIEAAGARYVERYGGHRAAVRRALQRRVRRAERCQPIDRAQAEAWIEAALDRLARAGLIDDGAWATARARRLQARGTPLARVRAELCGRGIGAVEAAAAVAALAQEPGDPDLVAALTLARRRRLGPFREEGERAARRERDLGALARAGFCWAVALRVIDSEDVEALEAEARIA